MTEQEQKELELFKEWFSTACLMDMEVYLAAETAWLARSKLDKERNETELL